MNQPLEGPLLIGVYVVDSVSRGESEHLVAELRARGHEVVPAPDTRCGVTVVLLPPGVVDAADPGLAELDSIENLIPVVFGDRASSLLADRSQIVRPANAVADVADRIGQFALLGGTDLIAVNELASAARRWDERGRPDTDLLEAARTISVPPLLALAHRAAHPEAARIGDFVRQSRFRQTRLQRRRRIILGIASSLLAAASVAALVFKANADTAAAAARLQSDIATSNRLASLAAQMLDSKPSPDLTWLLAQQAVETHTSPYTVGVARLVQQAIPQHRSIALGQVPSLLVTSDRGRLAILYRNGSFDVRDASGDVVRAWPEEADSTHLMIAMSSDGMSVAAADDERILVNRDGANGFAVGADIITEAPVGITDLGWQGDRLLVATRDTVQVWDPGSLTASPFDPTGVGSIWGIDVTPDGEHVVVWGDSGAWIADGDGSTTFLAPGIDTLTAVLTADGSTAYLLDTAGGLWTVEFSSTKNPAVRGPVSGGFLLMRTGDTVTLAQSLGDLCPMSPPAGNAARCFTAHEGYVRGAGSLGRQGYASIGSDGFLRLWKSLGEGTYAWDGANAASEMASPADGVTQRSHLECSTGGTCWAVTGVSGSLAVVDSDLGILRQGYVGTYGILGYAVAEGATYIGLRNASSGPVVRSGSIESIPPILWQSDQAGVWPATDALADDGRTYVAASAQGVSVWREDGYQRLEAPLSSPVGIVFGPSGDPRVYFADGSVVAIGDDSPPGLDEPLLALGAAEADLEQRLWWVNDDNNLRVMPEGGDAQTVAHLPEGFEANALRPSSDGQYVAVFAPSAALVVRADDGQVVYRMESRPDQAEVQDMSFLDGKEVLTIDRSGALRYEQLLDDAVFLEGFTTERPRPVTDEERGLFNIPAAR